MISRRRNNVLFILLFVGFSSNAQWVSMDFCESNTGNKIRFGYTLKELAPRWDITAGFDYLLYEPLERRYHERFKNYFYSPTQLGNFGVHGAADFRVLEFYQKRNVWKLGVDYQYHYTGVKTAFFELVGQDPQGQDIWEITLIDSDPFHNLEINLTTTLELYMTDRLCLHLKAGVGRAIYLGIPEPFDYSTRTEWSNFYTIGLRYNLQKLSE
jgi:hypothetical protein